MATIKDIARLADVNVSTVSRALRDGRGVGEETRRRIHRIADELGYIPDLSARSLTGKASKLVGVIVPEIGSNYYARIVNCIEEMLRHTGYSLITAATDFEDRRAWKNVQMLLSRKVDGIILAGITENGNAEMLRKIRRTPEVPMVFLDSPAGFVQQDRVLIDAAGAMDKVVEHLSGLGHRIFGFIGEELSTPWRLPLLRQALEKKGYEMESVQIRSGRERFEQGGYLRMKEMLASGTLPTAVFTAYDNMAIGVMKALQEEGIEVPARMSVVGFDDIRESAYLSVPLTTISPPVLKMASSGVQLLLKRLEGKPGTMPEEISLEADLIIRGSTGPVRGEAWIG